MMPAQSFEGIMRKLVKKLDSSARLAGTLLARAPSFEVKHSQLADGLKVKLSDGSDAQLALPHHTHLAVGDVLIDDRGMMVRVLGAEQNVLRVHAHDVMRAAQLACALAQGGYALSFDGNDILTEPLHALEHWLKDNGFAVAQGVGRLNPPELRVPPRTHAHDHADDHAHSHEPTHDHDHEHSHGHHHHHDHDHGHKH
jgi:urease accessory protein